MRPLHIFEHDAASYLGFHGRQTDGGNELVRWSAEEQGNNRPEWRSGRNSRAQRKFWAPPASFFSFYFFSLASSKIIKLLTLCIFQAQTNVFVCTRYRQRQTQQGCVYAAGLSPVDGWAGGWPSTTVSGGFTDRRLQSRRITRSPGRSPRVRPPGAHQRAASPPASASIWPRTCACITAHAHECVHECVHTLRQPRGLGWGGRREGGPGARGPVYSDGQCMLLRGRGHLNVGRELY